MNNKKLQKSISVLTTVTTTLWLSGAALLVPMASMAAIVDGDIVSPDAEFTEGDITYYPYDVFIVKIMGDKTFKRLVLNPEVFESYGHLEWGNIQTISADTVDGYTTSQLVRTDGDTKVYKLVPDGDTGTKEWMNMTAAEFGETYDWDSIYTVNSTDIGNYNAGDDVTTDDDDDEVTVSEGTLTVALAADTPASAIAVTNAARYPFTKINLTASGGDVIVDSMVLERTGFGQDGAFSSVAVILDNTDGDQLGNNKTLNSAHQTTLNDDLTVANGTTKTIYLSGNMGTVGTTYAGEVPSLTLTSLTLKGDASLNATLPVTGNGMTLNGTISIGTATITDGANQPAASTQNVGVTDYVVSAIKITAGSAEAVTVKKIVWTQDGSAGNDDIANIDVVNATTGEVLSTVENPDGKTLSFNPELSIAKGKNVSFDLRLDITDGSGRTISWDIDETTDILVKGETYGYYITPTYSTTGNGSRPEYNAPDTTVGDGSLRVESMSVSPTNIAEDASDVLLGKFKFVAKGEEVKITSIGWEVRITTSTDGALMTDITNLTVYDESGTAVAGPMDPTSDAIDQANNRDNGAATSTDTIIVPVGETIYTVKGDLSADFASNDIVQTSITPGTITARGMTTDNSITPTPATRVASTQLTVKAAALTVTVSSEPAAQTVVAGMQDFTLANYLFDATDSGSDVEIRWVKVPVETSTAYPAMISGLQLFDGTTEISVDTYSEGSNWDSTASQSATTTLTLANDALIIPAGTTKLISVVGDLGTGVTSGTVSVGIQADGVSAVDEGGSTVTETCTPNVGQAMSLSAGGTLNLSVLTDPASGLVTGGSEGVSIGQFTLQAKYEDINVNYLGLTAAAADGTGIDGDDDEITSISLYEDGVADALGTVNVVATTATITPSSTLTIPAGTTKNYTLKANFATIDDTTPATSGSGVRVKISNVDSTGVSAGSSSVTVNGTDTNFSSFSAFKSIPTVTKLAFDGSNVITGNSVVSLYKFSVTADSAGPIGLYKFTFGISTTTVNLCEDVTDMRDAAGYYLYMSDSESSLGSIVSQGDDNDNPGHDQQDDIVVNVAGSTLNQALVETWFDVNNDATGTSSEQIIVNAGDTKYFTLRGTISAGHDGTANNESISTVFAGDTTFAATGVKNADGIDALDQNDFIWSDLNADQYTSSTATVTAMYFNGYRVSGLDTTSSTPQTITD